MPTFIFRIGVGGRENEQLKTVARSNDFVVATFEQAMAKAESEISDTPGWERANCATLTDDAGMVIWSRDLKVAE